MTLTAATPARTNRNGHPCPSWCVTDHGREASGAHSSGAVHSAGAVVGAVLFPGDDRPEAQVCMPGLDGGSLFLDADRAGDLAVLVELLATATPEEHRELAAAIRSAAAVITGGLA